jgi:hypothetical protein
VSDQQTIVDIERPDWWAASRAASDDEIALAIRDMVAFRQSHVVWAEHFEAHPEIEAQYLATGKWDSAREHRQIVASYDRVLRLLRAIAPEPAPHTKETDHDE